MANATTMKLSDLLEGAPQHLQAILSFTSRNYSLDVKSVFTFRSGRYSLENGLPDENAPSCQDELPAEVRDNLTSALGKFAQYQYAYRSGSGDDTPAYFRFDFDKARNLVVLEAYEVPGAYVGLSQGVPALQNPDINLRVRVRGADNTTERSISPGWEPSMSIRWIRTTVGTLGDSLEEVMIKAHNTIRGIRGYYNEPTGEGRGLRRVPVDISLGELRVPDGVRSRGYSSMSSYWKTWDQGLSPDEYSYWSKVFGEASRA